MYRVFLPVMIILAAFLMVGCEDDPQHIATPSSETPPLTDPPAVVLVDRAAEYVLSWSIEGEISSEEALAAAMESLEAFDYPVPEDSDAEPEIGLKTDGGPWWVYPSNPAAVADEAFVHRLCFPVAEDSPVPEGFNLDELPGGPAARLLHTGDAEPDYDLLYDFCAANDLAAGLLIVVPPDEASSDDDEADAATVELYLMVTEVGEVSSPDDGEAIDDEAVDEEGGEQ